MAAWFRRLPVNPAGCSVDSIKPNTIPSPQWLATTAGKANAAESTKAGMGLNSRAKVVITAMVDKASAVEGAKASLSRDLTAGAATGAVVATRPEAPVLRCSVRPVSSKRCSSQQ
jgi:hypothetical protein